MTRAWVFNLDADEELAAWPRSYQPSATLRERTVHFSTALRALLSEGDVVVEQAHDLSEHLGASWCPTPRAVDRWRRANVRLPNVPTPACLKRVNHRSFGYALGRFLPLAEWITTEREFDDICRSSKALLAKRPFGFAGRGQRRLCGHEITEGDRRWVRATLNKYGGFALELRVDLVRELALHGFINETGEVVLGEITESKTSQGAWVRSERAHDVEISHRAQFVDVISGTAFALFREGYFGPFGVDAYIWRDSFGEHFNPRSEVNARYTMGWTVGMGGLPIRQP